jgi:serine phosphatase RsbU (regulator of sigma subunit)
MSGAVETAPQEKSWIARLLFPIAELFWPSLKSMPAPRRLIGAGEVLAFLYTAPLAAGGTVWLVALTDLNRLLQALPELLLLAGMMILFRKFGFFMISEIRSGRYATLDGSLDSMVLWVAVLLYGPLALWLAFSWAVLDFIWRWPGTVTMIDRWSRLRNFSLYVSVNTLGAILSILVYYRLGGDIPILDLSPQSLFPALGAFLVFLLLQFVLWGGYILYAVWTQITLTHSRDITPIVRFLFAAFLFPNIAHPFAALLAGAYSQNGPVTFSFFLIGMLMVAFLARQLSWAAEMGRQKSRQVEKIELLGRAILAAPPDASTLAEILAEHVPSMFPSGRVAVWLFGGEKLLKNPEDWDLETAEIETWLSGQSEASCVLAQQAVPWNSSLKATNAIVLAPVLDVDKRVPTGGVYLELHSLAQPWDRASLGNLYPAVQSLAAQVASALHQARVYIQALAYQRVSQELSFAGRIQASFLPAELPRLPGWQLAMTLLPARETSGDYFDLIPLSNGKLGLLIADVTDKGIGAALYMAISRTLIRTYAIEFDDDSQPEVILFAANNRLLADARADLFVTVFYGVLDPQTGELTYANAGHNPPYHLQVNGGSSQVGVLENTGMPIGVEEDSIWTSRTVQINPGDVLVLYTDGIPDAGNPAGDFFGDDLLIAAALSCESRNADEIQEAILETVNDFVDGAPQFDDITLLVLVRDAESE